MSTQNGWDVNQRIAELGDIGALDEQTAAAIAAQELERIKAQDAELERLRKIAAAAIAMRMAQREYFAARRRGDMGRDLMLESKRLESELDALLDPVPAPNTTSTQARLI